MATELCRWDLMRGSSHCTAEPSKDGRLVKGWETGGTLGDWSKEGGRVELIFLLISFAREHCGTRQGYFTGGQLALHMLTRASEEPTPTIQVRPESSSGQT